MDIRMSSCRQPRGREYHSTAAPTLIRAGRVGDVSSPSASCSINDSLCAALALWACRPCFFAFRLRPSWLLAFWMAGFDICALRAACARK